MLSLFRPTRLRIFFLQMHYWYFDKVPRFALRALESQETLETLKID